MQQQTVRAYRIKNEAETRAFALALADKLQAGDVLALIGELGTGKTALTRYIGEGLEYFFGEGVCVVEWADLIAELLPENTKYIYLQYGENPEERIYQCTF